MNLPKILKEPLVVFLLIALVVFGFDRFAAPGDGSLNIELTDQTKATISAQWEAQMGRPPTAAELEGLLEQWLKEEIYYREAESQGLADNDVIIRRRLVQKLTFLTEDIATAGTPDPAALEDYYQSNSDRYKSPATWTFSHRYFSNESRDQAQADATAALANPEARDDPFMLQKSYARQTRQQIAALFGTDFATAVAELEVGSWQGPVLSAYGWHIVRVDNQQSTYLRPYEEVVKAVQRDFLMQRREEANQRYYEALRAKYEIDE